MDCSLRQLPAGTTTPADDDWDLLYVDAAIQDPFIDLPRLLLDEDVVRDLSPYVRQAARRLGRAQNLDEARDRLQAIHRIVHDELPLIPLWQIVDHCAYREELRGIGERPVTLYQNVRQWHFNP